MKTRLPFSTDFLASLPEAGSKFLRLALVASPGHLDSLGAPDPLTLVVTSEWLTWRLAEDRGFKAVHYEALLTPWPESLGDPLELYRWGCSWMYRDGKDPTLFLGVSLGRQFASDVTYLRYAFERLAFAIDRLCDLYRVEEILFIDIRDLSDVLTAEVKRILLEEIADKRGIKLIERASERAGTNKDFHFKAVYGKADEPEKRWRTAARTTYTIILDMASWLLWRLRNAPPSVLLWVNVLSLGPLVDAWKGGRFAPVILSGAAPKNLKMISKCLQTGISLAHLPLGHLTGHERQEVDAIISGIEKRWSDAPPSDVAERALRLFVRERVFKTGRMHEMACRIKAYDRLFRRWRFARVVVGDLDNAWSRILSELARKFDGKTDEMPNGVFLVDMKNSARCGDQGMKATLTRQLSWGDASRQWLRGIGSPADCVTTGYPALKAHPARITSISSWRRALVLPIYACLGDPTALSANVSGYMLEFIVGLKRLGINQIRVKLHPEQHVLGYFVKLLDYAGLDCEIYIDGPLSKHVEWADMVVGPIISGAFVETLAQGKSYYPVVPFPSSVNENYLQGIPVVRKPSDLIEMIEKGIVPDNADLLQRFCSASTITNSSQAFWSVMERSL